MLSKVEKLSNAVGECERIHQTAVPLNYARHSLRSLTMWLFTLPFALIKDYGLMTGPIMGATAWLLFGVYQIGHSIEDPFQGTLRLSVLCEAIRKDVLGAATDRDTAYSVKEGEIQDEDWSSVTGVTCSSTKSTGRTVKSLLELEEYDPELVMIAGKPRNSKKTVILNTSELMEEKVENWASADYSP
jgi:hypothetical protein